MKYCYWSTAQFTQVFIQKTSNVDGNSYSLTWFIPTTKKKRGKNDHTLVSQVVKQLRKGKTIITEHGVYQVTVPLIWWCFLCVFWVHVWKWDKRKWTDSTGGLSRFQASITYELIDVILQKTILLTILCGCFCCSYMFRLIISNKRFPLYTTQITVREI